jgi:hypothetical protein
MMEDVDILETAQRWLETGHGALLATVVRTWGSSPRPEGSMLIVRDDGRPMGSVSGGCIEDDLIAQVQRDGEPASGTPWVTEYGVDAADAHRFGLPCGGTIRLVMEALGEQSGVAALVDAVRAGRLAVRMLDIASGFASVRAGTEADTMGFDGDTLVTVHGPRYRLLLIGAGSMPVQSVRVATTPRAASGCGCSMSPMRHLAGCVARWGCISVVARRQKIACRFLPKSRLARITYRLRGRSTWRWASLHPSPASALTMLIADVRW